jgi:hypothetical protein
MAGAHGDATPVAGNIGELEKVMHDALIVSNDGISWLQGLSSLGAVA